MWALVVGVDVAADRLAGLGDGLELRAPDQALLELSEPRLDERLRLGVAIAAGRWAIPRPESTALNLRAVNAEPLSVPKTS